MSGAVTVHVVPRAAVTAVAGVHGDAVRIRVAAPPVDGAANAELVRFVAERLDVRRDAVTIARGAGSRDKVIAVRGLGAAELRARLLADAGAGPRRRR